MITRAQKALLHLAKNQLRLEDDVYRALLNAEAGVESSTDLDNAGLNRVLKRLERLGFKNTAHRPRPRQTNGVITAEQQQLIERNFNELARRGIGFQSSAQRMAFNERQTGKKFPQTRTEAAKIIEGQKAILQRDMCSRNGVPS